MATTGTVQATDFDRAIERAQAAYLDRVAPGYRTRRVRWSGGTTQLIEMGTGEPLLLIHGGGGYAAQWGPILCGLAKRHRVLAIDRPGHGLADPFHYKGVDVLEHCHRFVADFLDGEKLQSVLIAGNSMGGLCASAFAFQSAERVRHLLLIGFPAGMRRNLPLPMRMAALPIVKTLLREAVMKRPTRQRAQGMWKRFLVAHLDRVPQDFMDLEVLCQRRNVSTWISLMDRLIDSRGFRPELVISDRLKTTSVPTTFIWGDRDAAGRADEAEALAAQNTQIRVRRIADAGHVPWFDDPNAVIEAVHMALA